MKRLSVLLLAAAAIAALPLLAPAPISIKPAQAAATVLCAPNPLESQSMRQITNPNTGTTYTLNGQGCAVVNQADVGYFLSQGFSPGPPYGASLLTTTGVWTGTTAIALGTLPPSTYIQHIIAVNSTANAVTGGIAIGTTANGTDVVAALTCGANCLTFVADSALLKRVFSTTAGQALFAAPVTAGNNANVTITVVWGYF